MTLAAYTEYMDFDIDYIDIHTVIRIVTPEAEIGHQSGFGGRR